MCRRQPENVYLFELPKGGFGETTDNDAIIRWTGALLDRDAMECALKPINAITDFGVRQRCCNVECRKDLVETLTSS